MTSISARTAARACLFLAGRGMMPRMVTEPTRRTVRNGDIELAVFEAGDPEAPTVLLVHGWPDTHQLWHAVTDRLADELHVVSYDTRGMGQTTDPGAVERFALGELADDLFAVADAVSPDAPVHVLAHDWGSVQAWEAVCDPRAAGRIASFVSISGPNIDHMAHWVRHHLRRPTLGGLLAVARQALSSSYVAVFVSPIAPPLFRRFATRERWQRMLERQEGLAPHPAHHADTLERDMVSGFRYYRANVARGLGGPRERRTAVPVLQLVPTEDPAIRGDSYEETALWVEHVERRDVPCGHWVPLSRPDLVAEETARFIRSIG
jgi:pimeloyl-ACP methyl ester carboxylesterase